MSGLRPTGLEFQILYLAQFSLGSQSRVRPSLLPIWKLLNIHAKSLVLMVGEAGIPHKMKVRNLGGICLPPNHQWCRSSTILCQQAIFISGLSASSEIT